MGRLYITTLIFLYFQGYSSQTMGNMKNISIKNCSLWIFLKNLLGQRFVELLKNYQNRNSWYLLTYMLTYMDDWLHNI